MPPRISVIIPALNEADVLGPVLARVAAAEPWELILADGESTDGTAEVARSYGARIVRSQAGRGRQMNRGATAATGDVLLFLHADTYLPVAWPGHVRRLLARRGVVAGAFSLATDAPLRALRLVERVANWRSRVLGLPYGDQAIFLRTETFRRIGGYPDVAAMEDFELVRRLRRLGRVAIAPEPVVTSARRWRHSGVGRTTCMNQLCVAAYLAGISADRIARWRKPRNIPVTCRPRSESLPSNSPPSPCPASARGASG
jgi:rSAM/selenodomain-associated transferase 2